MKLIERTHYLEQLKSVKGVPDIKVITGIRRCGKSKLMEAYIDYIKQIDRDANIVYIDFMDLDFEDLKDAYNKDKEHIKFKSVNFEYIENQNKNNKLEVLIDNNVPIIVGIKDKETYDKTAKALSAKFNENFKKYTHMPENVVKAGPNY